LNFSQRNSVADSEQPAEGKQKAKTADAGVTQPPAPPPQEPPATGNRSGADGNPQPSQPLLVRLVGGEDLEPFEEQTLALARESLTISKGTFGIAILGFLAALAAAVFVGVQVFEMTKQTQIFASQTESAAAGSLMDGMNTRKQLAIAQQQAAAAQESAQAIEGQTFQSERPWVAVSITPASDFQYDEIRGGFITLKFTLTNVGHSLAKYTSVWTDLAMNEKWPEYMKRICAIPKAKVNAKSDYGYLLFPGQSVSDMIPAAARVEDIRHALATTPFQGGGVASVDVVVCVDYESVMDSLHHQTRIVRGLSYPDPARGVLMGAFAPNRSYSKIILTPRLHGDSAD
jgi:hypothetical protein